MKNAPRLILIFGTLTVLIVIAFTRYLIKDTPAGPYTSDITQQDAIEAKWRSSPKPTNGQTQTRTQSKNRNVTSGGSICDENCQDEIFNALRYGGILTEDMIARIRSNPAGYAKQLMGKPKILSYLFLTLKADEGDDNGTQIAALAVFQALSDEEKLTLGQALSAEVDSQDRIVGLELLEASLGTQAGSLQTLNQRLVDESHPSALSKAIHIASNLPTTAQIDGTVQALTEIIRYNTSDHFSGAALLAKVNLAPRSIDVYEDISVSLISFSEDKNEVGLTALQNALQRYETEFAAEGGWYDDFSLREKVRAIAQNNEVSEATRTEASNLLNSYFSDDD